MKSILQLSSPHDCGYFSDRKASSLFIDPTLQAHHPSYQQLLNIGFRRSGKLIYKPHCTACSACLPLRVCSKLFVATKSQKRVLAKNADIKYQLLGPQYSDEHFRLYKKYQSYRHAGGGMEKHSKLDYFKSMIASDVDTMLIEFRLNNTLAAIAVTDILDDGLSAVYTFFDPGLSSRRSLGSLAILTQIELARLMNRSWIYLGYWISESAKMAYKSKFSPSEALINGNWTRL